MLTVPAPVTRNHFLDALRGVAALLVLATHLQSSIVGFYPSGWLAAHPAMARVLEHGFARNACEQAKGLGFSEGIMGFPRFGGHRSGIRACECTSSNELLLVINRAEVAQR